MVDPIQVSGLAASTVNELAKGVTEVINNKEYQQTTRLRTKVGVAISGADCLQQIIAAYSQYQEIAAKEQTKRRDIEAQERIALKKIEYERDVFLKCLDGSFDERAKNFKALFNVLDQAIASDNNQQVGLVLDKITELAKSNPFKDFADLSKVQAALADPNHEWTL